LLGVVSIRRSKRFNASTPGTEQISFVERKENPTAKTTAPKIGKSYCFKNRSRNFCHAWFLKSFFLLLRLATMRASRVLCEAKRLKRAAG